MNRGDYLQTLLRSKKSVFTFEDVVLLWGEPGTNAARVRLNYYLKSGELHRIRRGLYAKDKNYDTWEAATRIFTPSYVSFETVLAKAGVTFQYYNRIFVATYLARVVDCDTQTYQFRKIKDVVLTNSAGVEITGERSVASTERALLDVLYLNTDYHFDNLIPINWEKSFELLEMYDNKRMVKKIDNLYRQSKTEK